MESSASTTIINKSHYSTSVPKKAKADGIYRVNRKLKIKDDELPYTNINLKASKPTYDQ